MNVLLSPLDVVLIVKVTLVAAEFACKGTIGVVVENVLLGEVAEGLVEATNHVHGRGLKEEQLFLLDSANLCADFAVEGKEETIVILVGADESVRVEPEVSSSWLIEDVVADDIGLVLEELNHLHPHLDELIIHPSLICEEVVRKTHHVIAYVVLEERKLHAVLLQRQPLRVPPKRHLEGSGEAWGLHQPTRKTLPTKLFAVKVMMCIDDDRDAKSLCLPDYLSKNFQVGVVVLKPLRFKTFPSHVEAN